MPSGSFISYARVSTARQGQSGLGLDAQREAVSRYLNGGDWKLLAEYVEIESGRKSDRPQLAAALAHCRATKSTLIVAKLDRLARNAAFLLTLIDSGADVLFCDLPDLPAGPVGRFMLTQMAAVAELEAGLISQRTKAALAAAKERGVKLGGYRGEDRSMTVQRARSAEIRGNQARDRAEDVMPMISLARSRGASSLRQIAEFLNEKGVKTARGSEWQANSVRRILSLNDGRGKAPRSA
ncbi:recombinase family protein [Flavisphingomonas formosensis]|uniref:recombinase family protein n=1 Tax=Flavisphingomonas formosensis TaxID=861534 RepID=UPI0012FC32BA|nr:recombinase family protein [Sphingomonas formosensis]